MRQTELFGLIIRTGLKSIAANENRFEMPLRFQTLKHEDTMRWQETNPTKNTRR